ncbi:MAG: TonB-dependent receptor plug domain-containing protein, partial [Gemmatimonadetes bacterium]|nr:TonB-dependent receptor plug domain-containing protein [Gemmatimonadota bacterium]
RVNMTMKSGSMETVEVVGTAAVVDISSSTAGATIGEDIMSRIPLGRSFSNTLALAPGVVGSGIDDSNPSIAGASGLENTYVVDGVNINNTGYGSVGSYSIILGSLGTGVNFDYIKEVQVKTGGYEPEYGEALGGFVNLVTKTGGNEHKGSVFGYAQSSSLEGTREKSDRELATYDEIGFTSNDFGFEVGGPISKDRLFYYAAFDPTYLTLTRASAQATGFTHEEDINRTIWNYAGNLKWLAHPRHTLTFSAFGDPSHGDMGAQRTTSLAVADPSIRYSEIDYGGNNFVGRWEGELNDNSFIEASVAYHGDEFKEKVNVNQPSGTDFEGIISGNGGTDRYGGVGFLGNSESSNYQYSVKLSNFFQGEGEHNLRFGVQYQDIGYNNTTNYTGPAGTIIPQSVESGAGVGSQAAASGYTWQITANSDAALYPSGYRFRINRIRSGELTSETTNQHLAFFLSDSWSPNDWLNFMAGIRYEQNTLVGSLSKFSWGNNWGPRFHVTLDPTQDHRSKVSFAYGRFFGKIPNDLAVRALSAEVTQIVSYDYADVDFTDPNNPVIPDPSLAKAMLTFGDVPTVIDPDSKVTYQDEYVMSAERDLRPNVNVGVTYTHRSLGRTLEDVAMVAYSDLVSGAEDFGEYFITNPSEADGFPKPSRKYDALTFSAQKRYTPSDPWQLMGSYTWSKLKGNYEGYYRRDNGQSDPFITSLYDFPYLRDPDIFKYLIEDGVLPNDRTHVFNMFGSYTLDMGLTFGANLRVQTGIPLTKLGHNEAYGSDGEIPLESRGGSGRTPTTTNVGLHADYAIQTGGRQIALIADVFNLLNQQKGTDYDQNYEVGGVGLVSNDFGKPTKYEDPLSIRFAIRVSQ